MDDLRVKSETIDGADPLEGYRETEIGTLPEEWEVARLGDLAARTFGGGTPSTKKPEFWDGSIPWTTTAVIDAKDTYLQRFQRGITEEGLKGSSTQIAPKNSVLIGTRVGVGKAVVTMFDVAVNQDITVFVPGLHVDPEFLSLLLKMPSLQRWFSENKRGTTIKGVPRSDILRLQLPLPPLPEQQSIAHVLRTVQKAIETTEQVIESTRELKRSLMNHLFTYGPVPVDEAEQVLLKETEIGPVPEHWETISLGSVARSRFKNGIFVKGPRWGSGTRYLNVADVYPNSVIDVQTLRLMEIPPTTQQGFEVEAGDVLFVRSSLKRGGIAKACTIPPAQEDIVFDCHLIKVSPDQTVIHPHYLVEYCRSTRGHTRLIALSKTTTMTTIPQANLAQFQLPLPPLLEQEEISEALRAADRKAEVEKNRQQTLEILFKTLLHNLMTGKLRVKDLDLSEVEAMV